MRKRQVLSPNYEFFINADTSQYKSEWIAIAGNRVIAHGKDAQRVYQTAKKKARGQAISLAKTPEEQVLVLKFAP